MSAPSVTVEQLDQLVAEIETLEIAKETKEEEVKELNKQLGALKMKATGYLKELGREEYACPRGKIVIVERWNVKSPATQECKQALFEWMKERGIYDTYATVNAQSLKSLYMAERDAAIKNGEDPVTWALPGMEPANLFEDLKFTRSRKS
jgi:hypothetical protein